MLIVVGGYEIVSTEIQITRTSAWKTVAPIQEADLYQRLMTINNIVYSVDGTTTRFYDVNEDKWTVINERPYKTEYFSSVDARKVCGNKGNQTKILSQSKSKSDSKVQSPSQESKSKV